MTPKQIVSKLLREMYPVGDPDADVLRAVLKRHGLDAAVRDAVRVMGDKETA